MTTTEPQVTVIPAKNTETAQKSTYKPLRVAAYCRVSTAQEEQQNSYQVQIAYYTDLIHKNENWMLAGIFADEGISGTQAKKRPEFLKMIRQCRKGKIDLILTKSISRFARNTVDCLEYVRQLKELGIGVIFEKEGINTLTITSEFMIALYGSFAQAESESISKNVAWGKEKAYREGKVNFQYAHLLGYRKGSDGNPEIVPEEAETVREIFRLFLDGYSFKSICTALESKGRLTAHGKTTWVQSNVRSILQNEKYVGDALLCKTYTVDCISKRVQKNHGERPMYLISNHHEAIIDRDTFNRVQMELARRKSKRKISDKTKTEQGKYTSKYALSELLVCGKCGTPYRRTTWASRGKKQIVWRCISRLEHGKKYCPESPTLKEENLHRAILKAVNEYFGCSEELAEILKMNIGSVLECQGQQKILKMRERLRELDAQRNDLVMMIASGTCSEDTLDTEFAKIFAEEQELNAQLQAFEIPTAAQEKTDSAMQDISKEKFQLEVFDDIIIRKVLDCVKVLGKTELLVVFKGNAAVNVAMED